mgnify:CR=1 FL=1
MRILVVEDEKRIADFLARGLESAGYAVDVAGDGNTAVDMVHAAEYDMVVLDLYYIENISWWLDLQIMFKTIPAIFQAKGVY